MERARARYGWSVSIHLVGGGSDLGPSITGRFVAETIRRGAAVGRTVPRIALLAVAPTLETDVASGLADAVRAGGSVDIVTTTTTADAPFATTVLSDVDGLVIAGGRTPEYVHAVAPLVDQIRLLVADGLPYLGYSAGAVLAADRALIGGWRIGGVPVCPERSGEGLDEVDVAEGLGLVDLTVEVHAAQAGTLARLVAAAEAGFVSAGLAIDEDTALIVGDGALEVVGTGSVWRVVGPEDDDDAFVRVATMGG